MAEIKKEVEDLRRSAEEMDEIRQNNLAYEYLCHLEEAKKWLEAVLREELPPTTELEENLRNGVYLAKLGHFTTPEVVPLSKIYDMEQKRYRIAGLQFRHTDNINYWLNSLEASALPVTFHPETFDVYDKKGMPRVIYCLHALSTHLYKLGKAPLIQDLYGKVNFTDEEIDAVRQELKKYGIQMPAFQKIGGILANDMAGDVATLHAAVIAINETVDSENTVALLQVLTNPAARLQHVEPACITEYWKMLNEAKIAKAQAALNRSSNDSYIPDIYDELLTQAEIQGHITAVNVHRSWSEVVNAVTRKDQTILAKILLSPCLDLKDLKVQNMSHYVEELIELAAADEDCDSSDKRRILQLVVTRGNERAEQQQIISQAMGNVNTALEKGTMQDLCSALKSPALQLEVNAFALPLYFEEMRVDKMDTGRDLVYSEVQAGLRVLTRIATVSQAVDLENPNQTWEALSDPEAHFFNLDSTFKVKYWHALTAHRQQKLANKSDCPLLTYYEVQECIYMVNKQFEDDNQMIVVLHDLNAAVKAKDAVAVTEVLKHPVFQLSDNVCDSDAALYLNVLQRHWNRKQFEEAELWLDDVQNAVKEALCEVYEAQSACVSLSQINRAIAQNNLSLAIESIALVNLGLNGNMKQLRNKFFEALKDCRLKKGTKFNCPWISHCTSRGNHVFLNMEIFGYSWTKPSNFQSKSQYLTQEDIKDVVDSICSKWKNMAEEKMVVRLQSRIRGYLLRKSMARRYLKSVIKIQAWWRGIRQRRAFHDLLHQHRLSQLSTSRDTLSYYQNEEKKIVRLQAIWRGRQARRAFLSLFNQKQPSFTVVRYFVPLLDVNSDDYRKELQLQNLKGQVVQTMRRNQQLSQQLDIMDIKIGLLVHNRITLQDVVAHSTKLNDLTRDGHSGKGLKSLTKDSRKLLEGYQHLFYLLQTSPNYLAKLMFCLPQSRTTKFLKTVILALFNFGSNLRENYLLLRLFQSALQEEIRSKFQKPSDMITNVPLVLMMVVEYARQIEGGVSLKNMIGPLVQNILDDKTLSIDTNPIDIYKTWRNQLETSTGKCLELPHTVTQEQALSYEEVRVRLQQGIKALKDATVMFLECITQSRDLIPYGMLYIAKVLRATLVEKFPSAAEKDILKVVGNLIYYHFINSAIVAPESFGIITLSADQTLSYIQRHNLASIAKILQFSASKKGFGEESNHLMGLNTFIIECHRKFKKFFRHCCDVEDLQERFSVHQYSEATLISRPIIYITLQEICDTHKLLLQYVEAVAPDPMDPLCELLDEMGPAPSLATLMGTSSNDAALLQLGKTEVCLTLVNKFEVPEDDVTDINKLFIKAKDLLVCVLPCLHGNSLLDGLMADETPEQDQLYEELVEKRSRQQTEHKLLYRTFVADASSSLRDCKLQLRQYLCKLELAGLVSQGDDYQTIITAIAHDICNKGRYRQVVRKELLAMRLTKNSLDQKTAFYEEQVALYNQYIQKCLENLNAGKRNVHSIKSSGKQPGKMKSKLTLKYTAAKLHEKGILIEIKDLPASQFKNVQFEIAPTDHNGVFTIHGKFMGVEVEKVDVDIQNLLQLQFEGVSIMDIFGKATVNVNLLLFLLNKKFYGKT